MANIKVGDLVVKSYGDCISVKIIKAINPKTISLVEISVINGRQYETAQEPREYPNVWRLVVPETVKEIQALYKEAHRLQNEAHRLYLTLPKIEL